MNKGMIIRMIVCLLPPCLFCMCMPGRDASIKGRADEAGNLMGNPLKGRNVFVSKGCIKCHAVWGVGGKVGPDLARVGMGKSLVQIAGAMWNHGPDIWAEMERARATRPTFVGTEMADIVSYLYFLRYSDKPGDRVAGKRLFVDKGCAQCHSPAHTLGASAALTSPIQLMAAMWNHGPMMEKLIVENGLNWPIFQGDEMRDLIEYVRSSASRKKETTN